MKVLSINAVPYGSTCKMMTSIAEIASEKHDVVVATGFSSHPVEFAVRYIPIGGLFSKAMHMILAQVTGKNGQFSYRKTRKFLKQIDQINPDIIHLHNLHGWFIHLPTLFSYIKKHKKRVIWTLHDCWAFTGHCPHFVMAKCDKWKNGCHHCPSYKQYPQSFVDNSKKMYQLKKKWFTGVENLTIVTPSRWLADLVGQSFLKEYPVKVIHNGIDLNVFRPMVSNFREKYHISENRKILLGVAFGWSKKKGLDVFVELAKRLDPDIYQIVLVGTDAIVDAELPENIISIHRTQNQSELAEIYTAADLFINPTREDTYPTVNMEALACGTPVLTFRTGGSPEILDETCGMVVDNEDAREMERQIIRICTEAPYTQEACLQRADNYDMQDRFKEYVKLYEQ